MALWLLVCLSAILLSAAQPADPLEAVGDLIGRVLPEHRSAFALEIIPVGSGGKDAMQLASSNQQIVLRGSSGVALASALNWYLNDYCNTTYDWNTYALVLPSTLPLPPAAGTDVRVRRVKYSYYMNVCTYGYSLAFSSWDYWVKHIDWMALNGINLPLAFVGQEAVVVALFTQLYNLTFAEVQDFVSGPAFLPWYRMGNIQGWGGPLPLTWIEARQSLQVQILTRMRALGMTPVLSAFAGHIPEAFLRVVPTANVTRSPDWCNFPAPYGSVALLEPTDPHFQLLGAQYLAVQQQLYGTDHVYNADTYNEMNPRSSAPSYLAASSRAVFNAMTATDPQAIWMMQGWLFRNAVDFWKPPQVQAYLGAVPNDRMWILDLSANDYPIWSRTGSFYGKPFIWCTLLNFGGQQGLSGDLPVLQVGVALALPHTMIGVGITMEGIWQNYPVFEYTLSLGWNNADPAPYIADYAARRYGYGFQTGIDQAWQILLQTTYSGGGSFGSLVTRYPTLQMDMLPALQRRLGLSITPAARLAYHTSLLPAPTPQDALPIVHVKEDQRDVTTASEESFVGGTACAYSMQKNVYLALYPPGFDPSRPPYPLLNLNAALQWCDGAGYLCGGITLHFGNYEARAGWTALPSPANETSWIKLCTPPLVQVWHNLLEARTALSDVPSYRFDLVDVTRQYLSNNFSSLYVGFVQAFMSGVSAVPRATQLANAMLTLLDDFDNILSSDSNFMLGPWIASARAWGLTDADANLFEFNARNQLTLWGPTGQINDYAAKSWGGLVRDYYTPRWRLFLNMALDDLAAGRAYDPDAYNKIVYPTVELAFQTNHTTYPVVPEHDAIAIALDIYRRYVGSSA